MRSPASAFSTGTTQDGFPVNIVRLEGQNHKFRMIPFYDAYISKINDTYPLYLLVPSFSTFEPTPPVEETLVAMICELC